MKIKGTQIRFKRGKKQHAFKIYHNLPTTFGLNIECAVDNWLARTDEFTPKSLCAYIKSKDSNFTAFTEDEMFFLLMKSKADNHEKENKNT